jgi:hypothetical protein
VNVLAAAMHTIIWPCGRSWEARCTTTDRPVIWFRMGGAYLKALKALGHQWVNSRS